MTPDPIVTLAISAYRASRYPKLKRWQPYSLSTLRLRLRRLGSAPTPAAEISQIEPRVCILGKLMPIDACNQGRHRTFSTGMQDLMKHHYGF